jgi:hypothetical protein
VCIRTFFFLFLAVFYIYPGHEGVFLEWRGKVAGFVSFTVNRVVFVLNSNAFSNHGVNFVQVVCQVGEWGTGDCRLESSFSGVFFGFGFTPAGLIGLGF